VDTTHGNERSRASRDAARTDSDVPAPETDASSPTLPTL